MKRVEANINKEGKRSIERRKRIKERKRKDNKEV